MESNTQKQEWECYIGIPFKDDEECNNFIAPKEGSILTMLSNLLIANYDKVIITKENDSKEVGRIEFEIKTSHNFDPSITINTKIEDLFNKGE